MAVAKLKLPFSKQLKQLVKGMGRVGHVGHGQIMRLLAALNCLATKFTSFVAATCTQKTSHMNMPAAYAEVGLSVL